MIADCPGVASVAVVGRPDDHWGETVAAYVTLHDGAAVTPDDIRARCLARLAKYKVPETVTVLPEMPLNASGKILKRELRLRAASPA
ncbi:hypothetical protein AB0L25_15775 [Spirillospora sp. NPDC052242]